MTRPEIRNEETVFLRLKIAVGLSRKNRVHCPLAQTRSKEVSTTTCQTCGFKQEITERGVYCKKVLPYFKNVCFQNPPRRKSSRAHTLISPQIKKES
jgi:hypothetical protein